MKILIASTPATGHLNPLLAIGHILIAEGHDVGFLSGSVLRDRIERLTCGFSFADNYFAWQAFGRAYADAAAGPLPAGMPSHFSFGVMDSPGGQTYLNGMRSNNGTLVPFT